MEKAENVVVVVLRYVRIEHYCDTIRTHLWCAHQGTGVLYEWKIVKADKQAT